MKKFLTAILVGLTIVSCVKDECLETPCVGPVNLGFNPVCGCNGVTYENPSIAECHGIYTYSIGPCDTIE